MKLVHLGALSTAIVITLGLAMVIPAFTQHADRSPPTYVLLSFTVVEDGTGSEGASSWCRDLSSALDRHDVKAAIFLSGKTAEANPACVTSFSSGIDIGSQTYSYVNLTSAADYLAALDEVKRGKQAIDKVGNIDSRLFKAPYGSTDDNIYSFLHRSGILADFSYQDHYNKYVRNQFERYEVASFSAGYYAGVPPLISDEPAVIANFDSSATIEEIDQFISKIKNDHGSSVRFVNASELTGIDLTIRGVKL